MGRPEQRYLRNLVYSLTKAFKSPIGLYQITSGDFNPDTGNSLATDIVVQIKQAGILTSSSLRSAGFVASERPFQYGGLFDSRTRGFVVNRRDVPATFPVDNNMTIVYEHKRYQVKTIGEFGQEALLFIAEWVEGSPTREVVEIMRSDMVVFDDSASADGDISAQDEVVFEDGHVLSANGSIVTTDSLVISDDGETS